MCTTCRELGNRLQEGCRDLFEKRRPREEEDHRREREETAPVAANKICCRRRGVECNRLLNDLCIFVNCTPL